MLPLNAPAGLDAVQWGNGLSLLNDRDVVSLEPEHVQTLFSQKSAHQVFHAVDAGHHGNRRGKADKHAPAGIMGDHVHGQGEWMVEYKYMNMYMDDNIVGDSKRAPGLLTPPTSIDGIVSGGIAVPTQMTMEMHMIHLMYGVTDQVTAYTMINVPSITMDHIRGPGNPAGPGSFSTHNSGFGDTHFGALVELLPEDEDDDIVLNLGTSVPTGDIYRLSSAPTNGLGPGVLPLPYPMRLGSGTFNFRPGITFKHYDVYSSWGMQLQTDLPVGRNYRGYSVSNTYQFNSWFSYLPTDNLALTFRIENLFRSNYDGADPTATNLGVHTNVESFRGGYWLNLGLGTAILANGHLFNIEFVPNLYQHVNGVQLETDWTLAVSWSKSF